MTRRSGLRRCVLRAGLLAALLIGFGLAPSVAPAVLAADGARVAGQTTFVVQPEKHRVRARADVHLAYDRPDSTSGGRVISYVLTAWSMAVPDQATNVVATRNGSRQPVSVRERDGFDEVRIDLRPHLASGHETTLRVTYDLPDGGARSSSPVRVGRAYISFYVFAHGDDEATVRIDVPPGFEVQTRGGDIQQSATADGGTTLTTPGSVDDRRWYVVVDGARPAALTSETLQVDIDGASRVLEVRAWPEDDLWAERVRDRITSGLVELHELNGLEWPVSGPLRVTESATSSLSGYAGFYDPGESGVLDEITISEEPDEMVVVHEAAHAWFNDGLLTGRWISEGLADAYAARALARLGSPQPDPEPAYRDTPVAFALNLWGPPQGIDSRAQQAREAYAYQASRQVIDSLVDEIGEARMRDVLAAAADQEIAFAGAPKRETQTLVADFRDWRYLLDLLEQVGGSRQAADLFQTFVASDVELPLLYDHEAAVRRYAALVDEADGWQPGYALRAPMARWAFDAVDREMDLAETALQRRAAIEPREAQLGLDDGGALRSAFEGAAVSYDSVVGLGDEEVETLAALADARATLSAERDPIVSIGLLGSDTSVDLAEAAAAYRAGHLGESREQAAEAVALIDAAEDVGRQRAALAAGIGVVLLVVGSGVVFVFRARRRRLSPAGSSSLAPGVEPSEAPATLAARLAAEDGAVDPEPAARAEDEQGT